MVESERTPARVGVADTGKTEDDKDDTSRITAIQNHVLGEWQEVLLPHGYN